MSFYNNLNKNNITNFDNNSINFDKNNLLVSSKPKLVDRNIIRKIKKTKIKIKNNTYFNKLKGGSMDFFKDNYGIIIIFSLLIFLLYYRYNDVKERRMKYKRE